MFAWQMQKPVTGLAPGAPTPLPPGTATAPECVTLPAGRVRRMRAATEKTDKSLSHRARLGPRPAIPAGDLFPVDSVADPG